MRHSARSTLKIFVAVLLLTATFACSAQDVAPTPDNAATPSRDVVGILMRALANADEPQMQLNLLRGINAALKGRQNMAKPAAWNDVYEKLSRSPNEEVRQQADALGVVFGSDVALASMRKIVADGAAGRAAREQAIESLTAAKDIEALPILHGLLTANDPLRRAAVRALATFDDPRTPVAILAAYPTFDSEEKREALNTLVSRFSSARALTATSGGQIARADLTAAIARRLHVFQDPEIDAWLKKNWGALGSTSEEKAREIANYKALLSPGALDNADLSRGRAVFAQTCQQCHTLYGRGGKIGPELTASSHTEVDYILENVINPNGFIGKDYQNTVVQTRDGQVVSGVLKAEEPEAVTIRTISEDLIIPRAEVVDLTISETSMMPEGLLQLFRNDEVVDLVAYLRSAAQVPILATPANAGDFFNGDDLTGWQGPSGIWRVENGVIVGEAPGEGIGQLVSEMIVADGTLSFEIKVAGARTAAGITVQGDRLNDGAARGNHFLFRENKWKGDPASPNTLEAVPTLSLTGGWTQVEVTLGGAGASVIINGERHMKHITEGRRRGLIAFHISNEPAGSLQIRNLKLHVPEQNPHAGSAGR